MIYRKLNRTYSNGYYNSIPNFEKVFPELSKIDRIELCHRLQKLNIEFYYEEKTKVNIWVRFTLPFAIVLIILMILLLPINFIINGKWGYEFDKNNNIRNWFRALKFE